MSQINHEAAKNVCHARLAHDMHPSSSDRNIALAYLDISAQLAAERERVQALCEVIYDANGVAYPFEDMQNKMTAILEGRDTQGDDA